MQSELNTVLRRQASNAPAAARAVQTEVRRGIASAAVRVQPSLSRDTQLRLVAPVAGFASAAIEISAVWPFEYAKTQLQLNRADPDFKVVEHMRQRGLRIYQGLAPLLIGAPLQGLLRFSALDMINTRLADPVTGKLSVASGVAAGVGAGVLESCLVVTPMETVKTQLVHSSRGLAEGVRHIAQTQGLRGMYKGLGATVAKSASNQALRFVIFNQYKNAVLDNPARDALSAPQALAGGMLAGALGALGNTPLDTIKSRMQGLEAHRYTSVWHCGSSMVREEGALSLYKGLLPRLGRVLPGQGIIFCAYEVISGALRKRIDG